MWKKPPRMLFIPVNRKSELACPKIYTIWLRFCQWFIGIFVMYFGRAQCSLFLRNNGFVKRFLQALFGTMLHIIRYIFVMVVCSSSDTLKINYFPTLFIAPTNFELCITTCPNKKRNYFCLTNLFIVGFKNWRDLIAVVVCPLPFPRSPFPMPNGLTNVNNFNCAVR